MADQDREIKALQDARRTVGEGKAGLAADGGKEFDQDIYGGGDKSKYVTELATDAEQEEAEERAMARGGGSHPATRNSITAPKSLLDDMGQGDGHDPFKQYREESGSGLVDTVIANREGEVRRPTPHPRAARRA
jgi:hypothetical protein